MLLQVRTALVEDWRGIARAFGYSTIETANGKITNVREGAPAKKRLVEMRIANQNDDDPQGEDKGKGPANVSNTSKPTKKRKAGSSSKGQPASKKKATVEKAKVSKAVEGNKTSTTGMVEMLSTTLVNPWMLGLTAGMRVAPSTEQRPEESEAPANHAMSTGLKLPESGAQSESNNQQNGEISLTTQMAAPTIDEEHPEKLFGVIAGTHDGAGVVFYDAAKDEVDSEDDEHGAAQAGMDF